MNSVKLSLSGHRSLRGKQDWCWSCSVYSRKILPMLKWLPPKNLSVPHLKYYFMFFLLRSVVLLLDELHRPHCFLIILHFWLYLLFCPETKILSNPCLTSFSSFSSSIFSSTMITASLSPSPPPLGWLTPCTMTSALFILALLHLSPRPPPLPPPPQWSSFSTPPSSLCLLLMNWASVQVSSPSRWWIRGWMEASKHD